MPSATATLSEFLRPRHGSRTTASQRASSSGARPCLRESLKRRSGDSSGKRRPGPTPAPRRSLPSSSAHPAGGGGKANSCAYGAPATVSTATTGTPAARSSSIAVSARRRHSHATAACVPIEVRATCASSGVAVYPHSTSRETPRHSAVRKIEPTLKAERRWSQTYARTVPRRFEEGPCKEAERRRSQTTTSGSGGGRAAEALPSPVLTEMAP
mmetsp:Transcript_19913/g.65177  ORF Transcript_19913/g.65177 Transcript_19913/m.65177 type:complete len:213 (+) Transcript_19913:184-822(+)